MECSLSERTLYQQKAIIWPYDVHIHKQRLKAFQYKNEEKRQFYAAFPH